MHLATHNFSSPSFYFKNSTYSRVLEISERTVMRSMQLLEEKGLIKCEERFDENGRQVSNRVSLLIPDGFMDSYESRLRGEGDNTERGDRESPLGVTESQGGGCQRVTPYNNNKNNNKDYKNKSSCDQAPERPKQKPKTRKDWKEENEAKLHWHPKAKVCEPITVDPQQCGGCKRTMEWCQCHINGGQRKLAAQRISSFVEVAMKSLKKKPIRAKEGMGHGGKEAVHGAGQVQAAEANR